MKWINFIFLITGILLNNISFSQETKNEYIKFIKDGIEFQTNGKDTICIVDPMPEFIGGKDKLFKYLSKNLKYPDNAFEDKIEGTVFMSFIVGKNGEIINVKVIKGIREDIDNEALRIIKKMPKWKPGKQNGNPIPVQMNLPIVFKI